MPIQALNQQTTPATRDTFTENTDVVKTAKITQEKTTAKVKQDQFTKSTNEETTYLSAVQNQINKTNTTVAEKTETPKTTAIEAQKITPGIYNPREVTGQKNITNEMTTQTNEMSKVKSNEEITA
jgi:hypothetical protein